MPRRQIVHRMPEAGFFFGRKLAHRAPGLGFAAHAVHHLLIAVKEQRQYVAIEVQLGGQDGIEKIHRSRVQVAANHLVAYSHCGANVAKTDQVSARGSGPWHNFEINGNYGGQRSERADHHFRHVQTSYVLHHHATGFHPLAFQRGELHANDQIPRGAIQATAMTADVGRHHSAYGGGFRPRAVEGQHLVVDGQFTVEVRKPHTCLDADSQVAWFILQQAAEAGSTDAHLGRADRTGHEAFGITAKKLNRLPG